MMQEQRPQRRHESFEMRNAVWEPRVEPPPTRPPVPQDHYAVVDDLDEDVLVLRVASWPRLDRSGRLRFERAGVEHAVSRRAFQERVDAQRTAEGTAAPDRPLRIGDTFWIQASSSVDEAVAGGRLVDVTAAAREAAKAAFHGAVGGTVGADYVRRVRLQEAPPPREGRGPVGGGRGPAARAAL